MTQSKSVSSGDSSDIIWILAFIWELTVVLFIIRVGGTIRIFLQFFSPQSKIGHTAVLAGTTCWGV